MTRHADLIAKLEAAPEGSRELDALIWAEQDNRDVRWEGNRALAKSRAAPYDECLLGTIDPGEHNRWFDCDRYGHNPPIPRYTTSLDAARSLFPKGSRWEVRGCFNMTQTKRVGICRIVIGETGHCQELEAEAATVELASCSAALKARAVEEGEG